MKPSRVVIVGGGVGGLAAARALAPLAQVSRLSVTLVNPSFHYEPIHRASVGFRQPLDHWLRGTGIRFQPGRVSALADRESRVELDDRTSLPYDHLILAVGGAPALPTLAGVSAFHHIYDVSARRALRGRLAVFLDGVISHRRRLATAIVGAGPTGVELAAELGTLRRRLTGRGSLGRDAWQIELIEAAPTLLPVESTSLRERAGRYLKKLGIVLVTNRRAEPADYQRLSRLDEPGEDRLLIWAGGLRGPVFLGDHPRLARDRRGRLAVDGYLRCPWTANIWAVGDCAALADAGTAPAAERHARWAADNLMRHTTGRPLLPYEPRLQPLALNLGGPFPLAGRFRSV